MMKASSTLVASLIAASSLALSSSVSAASPAPAITTTDREKSMDKGSYAPKFDGLRFIESLVTAHR
ncbi:uncharacterized protein LOC121772740 [Salvia splendens]|uniref:uncharacterized protein LOC121772740 n=1 Tax=Salvia splendens TaxID=180675 RepID=UPI001C27ABBB|nr:uncharacterized protein LOC121772740 [Salvia splendens]